MTSLADAKPRADRRWYEDHGLVALLLLLATLLLYTPGIVGAKFHFDDFHSLRDNPSVRSLANIPRFFVDPSLWSAEPGNQMYRPTLLTTFAVDFAIWDYRPSGWAITNVLLHAAVAILTWRLALRIGLSPLAAVFAGAVTALHPIHSEVANYISSRSESVAAVLMLGALHLHLSARTRSGAAALPWMGGAAALFALSLTAKETTALFFLAVVCLELLVPVRQADGRIAPRWSRAGTAFLVYVAVFALMMWLRKDRVGHATAPVDLFASRTGADPRTGGQASIFDNVLKTQSRVVAEYYDLLLRPVRLTLDHAVERTFEWRTSAFVALGIHTALAALALVAWRRGSRLIPLCFLWFWLFLAPSVAYPLNVVMNEHRLYLPGIAVALLVGAGLARVATLLPRGRAWIAAAPLVLFVPLTISRSLEWRDDEILWRTATERAPESARAWQHRGAAVHQKHALSRPGTGGELLDQAISYYEKAHAIFPRSYDNLLNLGAAYLERGQISGDRADVERSLHYYREAENSIAIKAPRTQLAQALVLTELGRFDEALAIIREQDASDDSKTRLYPDMEARTLRRKGDKAGAAAAMRRAIEIDRETGNVEGLLTLGWWYVEDGDLDSAEPLLGAAMDGAKKSGNFRPYLYAARMLNLLNAQPQQVAQFLSTAQRLGWSAPPDEIRWVEGGPTPGAMRTGTRGLPAYGPPR